MINKVFVYGTLKEGRPLDRKVFADLRLSVNPATIKGKIYHLNWYPGIKLGKGTAHGEIHEFHEKEMKDVITLMDRIEGYREGSDEKGNLFNRRIVKATLEDGEEVDAYAYEYNGKVEDRQLVKSGVWEPH